MHFQLNSLTRCRFEQTPTIDRQLRQIDAQQTLPRLALVGQRTDVWYVTVLVENFGTLIAAHQLAAVQTDGAPVLVRVVFVAVFIWNEFMFEIILVFTISKYDHDHPD